MAPRKRSCRPDVWAQAFGLCPGPVRLWARGGQATLRYPHAGRLHRARPARAARGPHSQGAELAALPALFPSGLLTALGSCDLCPYSGVLHDVGRPGLGG